MEDKGRQSVVRKEIQGSGVMDVMEEEPTNTKSTKDRCISPFHQDAYSGRKALHFSIGRVLFGIYIFRHASFISEQAIVRHRRFKRDQTH